MAKYPYLRTNLIKVVHFVPIMRLLASKSTNNLDLMG